MNVRGRATAVGLGLLIATGSVAPTATAQEKRLTAEPIHWTNSAHLLGWQSDGDLGIYLYNNEPHSYVATIYCGSYEQGDQTVKYHSKYHALATWWCATKLSVSKWNEVAQ